jgi:hypothetical protein
MAFNPFAAGQRLEQSTVETPSGAIITIVRHHLHAQSSEAQARVQALGVALQFGWLCRMVGDVAKGSAGVAGGKGNGGDRWPRHAAYRSQNRL